MPIQGLADPIVGVTLARQIHDVLTRRILNGDLAPGTRLKDQEVAASFGTSNTPAREALRQLEKDGLVEVQPHRGCTVRRISLDEVAEAYDLRSLLEPYAVRLAAGKLTDAQLRELAALSSRNRAALAAGDADQASEAGLAIHALLQRTAGNHLLSEVLEQIGNRIRLARRVYLNRVPLADQPGYGPIVDALFAHDVERAVAAMAEHIGQGRRQVLEALQDCDTAR